MRHVISFSGLVASVVVLGAAAPSIAVDGVVEINQASIDAAGGYPFVIGTAGSYRLTSDITADINVDAIQITVDDVTLDLNGFAIEGNTSCQGSPAPTNCSTSGTGDGIDSTGDNVRIMNGTIKGMANGIDISGNRCMVSEIRAIGNSLNGINVARQGILRNNLAYYNLLDGISCSSRGLVIENNIEANGQNGIDCGVGTSIVRNVLTANTAFGIGTSTDSGYRENLMSDNGTNVGGGTSMGDNLCDGSAC